MATATASARKFDKVCEILENYNRNPAMLIPILREVQDEYRYLPEKVLVFIATSLGIPPARIYGVASFYSHFTLKPKGKHVIKLCDGTACHVKGSQKILHILYEKLGVSEEKPTTEDLLFTIETVSCLGACGLAPVMLVDEEVHGQITPESAVAIIEAVMLKEKNREADK